MIKLNSKSRAGFSLVEVSISMVIGLLATIAIMSTFLAASRISVESFVRNQAVTDARLIVDRLTSDARNAITVVNSYKSFSSDNSTLILQLPAIDAQGFPIDIETHFDYVIYHPGDDGNSFRRTVDAHAQSSRSSESRVLGRSEVPGLYAVQPDALGAFVIYYRFRSVQSGGGKSIEIPAAGSVQLRNHQ